mmetsp:Transcript_18819/g.30834  ORF Transcript_18819/g.30834 Transcript_18819/m.30834 type:complete len:313 (-) Transcript_18819:108-1046(-)
MMMKRRQSSLVSLTLSALAISGTDAFSSSPNAASHHRIATSLSAVNNESNNNKLFQTLAATTAAMTILASPLITSLPANADEYGRETEAPTLFTGETTMICKKRGPLGACLETTIRTAENDNDKASKYFKDPSEKMRARQAQALATQEEDNEGNALIQKLRKQSADNKEKNDLIVRQKTLLNDQSASFGPFDRQVVILNTDGKTFTLLQNPQAMRLKKAGYIEDRKFIIQPTQQVIDDALEGKEEGLGDALKGFFGGGGDKSDVVAAVSESVDSESSSSSVVEEATTTTSVVEEVVSESQPESVDAVAVESS